MTITSLLESAAYRTVTDPKRKVAEAWNLVKDGAGNSPTSKTSRAQLAEAITTDDFPHLLKQGIQDQVSKQMQTVDDETSLIARIHQTRDFKEVKYRDLFLGAAPMRQVLETEEYKARDPFADTHIRFKTGKYGERFPFSWESVVNDEWDYLLSVTQLIIQDAVKTHNHLVFEKLITEAGQLSSSFFPEIGSEGVSYETLLAAYKELLKRRFVLGNFDRAADFSSLVLVAGPAAAEEAEAIISAGTITEIRGNGNNRTERVVPNRVRSITVQRSDEWAEKLAPEIRDTAWALLPGASTRNPALVRGKLRGHPEVEVRVKNDAGNYIGGGSVPYTEGNYGNDSIDFRGRVTSGVAVGFNYGDRTVDEETGAITNNGQPLVYASTGTSEG